MTLREMLLQPRTKPRAERLIPTKLMEAVTAIDGDVAPVPPSFSVASWQQHIVAAHAQGRLSDLLPREIRYTFLALFSMPRPLASNGDILDAVLRVAAVKRPRGAVLTLVHEYAEHFDPAEPGFSRVAAWLDRMVRTWDWEWRERATIFRFFVPEEAPRLLGLAIMQSHEDPVTALAQCGLRDIAVTGRFGTAVFEGACSWIARQTGGPVVPLQRRLIGWGRGETEFAFPTLFATFAEGLLQPWIKDSPARHHQELLIDVLTRAGGSDPRMPSLAWNSLRAKRPELHAIILRWLTRDTVFQFLDVVDQTAIDDMWKYRRAFWMSYLDKELIDEAWVVFGSQGARIARARSAQQSRRSFELFGELGAGGGRTPQHAALIMRLGSLTIVDWSHNGEYNIWTEHGSGAPRLYKSAYQPGELMNAPIRDAHRSSANFLWQSRVGEIIRSHTNRVTARSAWLP